jgi:hypothetical protein
MRPQHSLDRHRHLNLRQTTTRDAMISGLITDIAKEASVARSGSTDDETMPIFGPEFAPYGRRSLIQATPSRSRACPEAGPPPSRDLSVAFVPSPRTELAIGLRGIRRAGRFHSYNQGARPSGSRDASMEIVNPPPGWHQNTLAAQYDCNLHNSRAQFVQGANRVFDRQIDAS